MKLCLMILSVPWYMFNGLEHTAILSHFLAFITGSSSRLLHIRFSAAVTCINHFICYSRIVYIRDSLGHVICLFIYFRLAAMLLNILKCISMFILLPLTLPLGAY